MSEEKYHLSGFYSTSGVVPGFIVPVFSRKGYMFIQEINSESIVTKFDLINPINFPYKITSVNKRSRIAKNYYGIYGFIFKNREVIFGSYEEISKILEVRNAELKAYPFVHLNVLNFIQSMDEVPNTINRIRNLMTGRNKELAKDLANRHMNYFNLEGRHEQVDIDFWKNNYVDPEGYFNYWQLFNVLTGLIGQYGNFYAKCKMVCSVIGTNPKLKNRIKSFGFRSMRIGRISNEILVNRNNLHCLFSISKHAVITEVHVYADKEIFIKACDTNEIQKRYYKKDKRKVVKGKLHRDYFIQIK